MTTLVGVGAGDHDDVALAGSDLVVAAWAALGLERLVRLDGANLDGTASA